MHKMEIAAYTKTNTVNTVQNVKTSHVNKFLVQTT